MKVQISYEKTFQGVWRLSAIVNGYFVTRQYFYYTKKEATAEFKQEFKI